MKTFVTNYFENSLFAGSQWKDKSVLIIVPHESDELNLAGATICHLVQNKIKVRVVFCIKTASPDQEGLKVRDGLTSCQALGLADEDVIFLDCSGVSQISGKSHFYNDHTQDTKQKLRNDIKKTITLYKPDVLFINDFDRHPDHRAVSFIFEEAMAEILQTPGNAYEPEVYKGFAYNGSYLGKQDFYTSLNLEGEERASAEYSNNPAYDTDFPPYDWDQRLRLPVPPEYLSRTIKGSCLYPAIKAYMSQGLIHKTRQIINSDQIFWRRRTDSLTYQAKVFVSSGNGTVLNDFKLADCSDILQSPADLDAGTWIPAETDQYKEVFIQFLRPQKITRIIIHGNVDFNSRVLAGFLTFSNGKHLEFGSLRPGAKPTIIDFPAMENIVSVKLTILNTQGPKAGLNEIEIYDHKTSPTLFTFIKLLVKDTYAYDYWVNSKTTDLYTNLYAYDAKGAHFYEGKIPSNYVFTYVGGKNFKLKGSMLYMQKGFKEAIIKVTDSLHPGICDQILIHRKSFFALFRFKFVQAYDAMATQFVCFFSKKLQKFSLKGNMHS